MNPKISSAGYTKALAHALKALEELGWEYSQEADIILLPVPSFEPDGTIKGGGLVSHLPEDALIVGGNLHQGKLGARRRLDLLEDPFYLWENAAITAHCAISIVTEQLPVSIAGCPILIAGWGRIGKCLSRLLRLLGGNVTVAARSENDRAFAAAFGYPVIDISEPAPDLSPYRAILSTVPAMVFPKSKLHSIRQDCLLVDLASTKSIDDPKAIWARGLPGKNAPESSGNLIARIVDKELSQ